MKNLERDIEEAVAALQDAIQRRKIRMQSQTGPARFSPMVSHVVSEVFNSGPYTQIHHSIEQGMEFGRQLWAKVQVEMEEKPWTAVRKIAFYSFAAGFFLSLRRKSPAGKKT
jgi:hypothetical protein